MSLKCLSMRSGIKFGLGEVLYTYFLWEHDHEKSHYHLYGRLDRIQLVNHLRTNDSRWKQLYFFMQGDLVFGLSEPRDAPSFWKASSEHLLLLLVQVA